MLKAYKYRIYPNREQEEFLHNCFHINRKCWNHLIAYCTQAYEDERGFPREAELSREITKFINLENNEWMKGGIKRSLELMLHHAFMQSWKMYFRKRKDGTVKRLQGQYIEKCKRSGRKIKWDRVRNMCKPHFKKYNSRLAMQIDRSYVFDLQDKRLYLPKIKKSAIKVRILDDDILYRIPHKTKKLTINKTVTGKYYLSIGMETEEVMPEVQSVLESKVIGIDLGIKEIAILSDGKSFAKIEEYRKLELKLKKLQRQASRKYLMNDRRTENHKKLSARIARQWEKIKHRRSAIIHQITHDLVSNSDYQAFCLEDLNVSGMTRKAKAKPGESGHFEPNNKKQKAGLNRNILEANFAEFRRQLEYKAEWWGKQVFFCGRFDPSSKTCSKCGHVYKELKLSERHWVCQECKTQHDRDINAAKNIKAFAITKAKKNGTVFLPEPA